MTKAQAVLVQKADWQSAVQDATEQLADFGQIDLLFMFASAAYGADLPELVQAIYQKSGATVLMGCSGQGVIGQEREIEETAAVTLLALSLPNADLRPVHLTQTDLFASSLPTLTKTDPADVNAWLLLGEPYSLGDPEQLIGLFAEAYPGCPLIGGMASADPRLRQTFLFLNGEILEQGALVLAVGGDYTLQPVVSQGATPIGEAWMVTAVHENIIETISGRRAYDVLVDTFKALSPALQQQARRNLLVGLAVDEYKAEFKRGDFVIRNLMALDPVGGAIAIADVPRIGQTIQFQLRDAGAADEDLHHMLDLAKTGLGETEPLAGLLFSCNGRGSNLFPTPDHDARVIAEQLGALPLAGFFCNGEIGPVGSKTFIHGFTASLGLFVPK